MNILYAEDDINTRELLINLIEKYGRVFNCDNGLDCLEIIQNENIDLLITDNKMPGMSGAELVKIIRNENKNIPIIGISAYSNLDFYSTNFENLTNMIYFQKPLDLELFILTMNAIKDDFIKKKLN